ncbi:glycoside hydrolase family 92 protein [Prolixibacteraceae bacterium JC049]|nr:glycoside hydrolase family 92 protein [Prolixibacteraceae bacterium JC049]
MRLFNLFIVACCLLGVSCQQKATQTAVAEDPLQYVDPFIGTGFHGHTFPGATVPNSMVQLSPDTHLMGWEASGGYHSKDSLIYGFSHTHLSGTGIGDMGDVLLIPYTSDEAKPVAKFSKDKEEASAGYYKVAFDNYDVVSELTATKRVGMHRYQFASNAKRNVLLDLSHILQANWGHKMVGNEFKIIDNKTILGVQRTSGWATDHLIAYRAEFSEPFKVKVTEKGKTLKGTEFKGENFKVYLHFAKNEKPLLVKVALSPVDADGATKNLQAELPGWDFDKVVRDAKDEWRDALTGIEIETNDKDVKTNFYTAMYHSMVSPYTYQDVDGRYRGMNKEVMQAPKGFVNYTVFSLWDTFRAFHPLITIIQPERAAEWAESLVQKYREGGVLPKWPLASNYTGTMVGYPAVSVLADAVAKNLVTGDINDWLKASVTSSTYQADFVKNNKGFRPERVMPRHIYFKEKMEYVPCDSITASVSYGQEMAYYDWCVARIAEGAGNKKVMADYDKKAMYFKHYFDPSTGLMRGKKADGTWKTPFRPKFSDHHHSDYVEGNSWQWSFLVPHAIEELKQLHGGADHFESMLDTLFTTSSEIEGEHASADITGLIGQYAHGNEPSHHMAYLYNWTNAPHKTQEYIDQILYGFYEPTPAGIIGNEDCGQMSAWYVLSAMGFYQVCPGDATYTIGRPIVDKAKIRVPGGTFEIITHNNSKANKHVQKVVLNGQTLDKPFFSHQTLMKGGKLEFYMGSQPKASR